MNSRRTLRGPTKDTKVVVGLGPDPVRGVETFTQTTSVVLPLSQHSTPSPNLVLPSQPGVKVLFLTVSYEPPLTGPSPLPESVTSTPDETICYFLAGNRRVLSWESRNDYIERKNPPLRFRSWVSGPLYNPQRKGIRVETGIKFIGSLQKTKCRPFVSPYPRVQSREEWTLPQPYTYKARGLFRRPD